MWIMCQIRLIGNKHAMKKGFCLVRYDLECWLKNFDQGQCTSFDQRHSMSEVWASLDEGERRYFSGQEFYI